MITPPMSRPARARGLKRQKSRRGRRGCPVAPRAGAWIETSFTKKKSAGLPVAPRAGAWIETYISALRLFSFSGRAPRGRVD